MSMKIHNIYTICGLLFDKGFQQIKTKKKLNKNIQICYVGKPLLTTSIKTLRIRYKYGKRSKITLMISKLDAIKLTPLIIDKNGYRIDENAEEITIYDDYLKNITNYT